MGQRKATMGEEDESVLCNVDKWKLNSNICGTKTEFKLIW